MFSVSFLNLLTNIPPDLAANRGHGRGTGEPACTSTPYPGLQGSARQARVHQGATGP